MNTYERLLLIEQTLLELLGELRYINVDDYTKETVDKLRSQVESTILHLEITESEKKINATNTRY